MKKTYTKKQISEAIVYWKKQLRKMNESADGETYTIVLKRLRSSKRGQKFYAVAFAEFECFEGDQTNSDGIIESIDNIVEQYPEFAKYQDDEDLEDFGITDEIWTSPDGKFQLSIEPGLIPSW